MVEFFFRIHRQLKIFVSFNFRIIETFASYDSINYVAL